MYRSLKKAAQWQGHPPERDPAKKTTALNNPHGQRLEIRSFDLDVAGQSAVASERRLECGISATWVHTSEDAARRKRPLLRRNCFIEERCYHPYLSTIPEQAKLPL